MADSNLEKEHQFLKDVGTYCLMTEEPGVLGV